MKRNPALFSFFPSQFNETKPRIAAFAGFWGPCVDQYKNSLELDGSQSKDNSHPSHFQKPTRNIQHEIGTFSFAL